MQQQDFLEQLVSKKLISGRIAEEVREKFQDNYFSALLYLADKELAPKNRLGRMWGDTMGVAYTELSKAMFKKEIVRKLPEEFARKNRVILIYQLNKAVTAAVCNPENRDLLDEIEQITQTHVSPVFSFPDEIDEAIDKYYSEEDSLEGLTKKFFIKKQRINIDELPCLLSDTAKKEMINGVKTISQQAAEGKIPDISVCNSVKDTIVDEVEEKFDLLHCINQLRIVDEFTYSHSVNVSVLCTVMGKSLGYSMSTMKELALGALMHDIGKVKIPAKILNKPDKLNSSEIAVMRNHPFLGYQIIKNMGLPETIAEMAYNHHERIDGKGYPRGLSRDEIPIYSQIVSIIDVYDSFMSDLPYKSKILPSEAINIMMLEGSGTFNFDLLYRFVNLVYKEDFNDLKKTFQVVLYGEDI